MNPQRGKGLRLVAYRRVSGPKQVDGYGLAAQHTAVLGFASVAGHRIVKSVRDDALSGTLPADERPALLTALEWVRERRADGIVFAEIGRLARELTVQEAILAQIWTAQGRAFTATGEVLPDDPDDPMRTAMRQMAGVFVQLDRAWTLKRLRDGKAEKARAGGHVSGPAPYGWRALGGELVKITAQQNALRRMEELRNTGASTREIAAALTAEGHPTARGGSWSSPTVARILSRTQKAA